MPDGSKRRRWLVGGAAGAALIAVVGGGIVARSAAEDEQEEVAAANALPTVAVVRPQPAPSGAFTLPGNIAAHNEAAINARTSGYVARWYADIGDAVRAGQTLAVLDAPEVEQQLDQARLREKDAVSQQETDEKQGRLAAASASANAARANVERLRSLTGFTRITAPFSGIVTSRSAQLGALVSAGNAAAGPLFTIADVSRLRVYVRVPQNLSGQISTGTVANLVVPEHSGETFEALMVRNAGAVDRSSGTVLTEFQVSNPGRRLKPGGYAEVTIPTVANTNALRLPASSLILGPNGSMVAIVDAAGRVAMRKVTVGRDEGRTIEILTGLKPSDRVIQTPPDALAAGDKVRVVAAKAGAASAAR
ncbi:MAG: efflux transporter periplasmic adaptor subunit [Sphingobium sp. 32-64-5]|nr:MAG: efflux transporter periplasmic adaptor subunit [Sphingobium sp. 32-64-5]